MMFLLKLRWYIIIHILRMFILFTKFRPRPDFDKVSSAASLRRPFALARKIRRSCYEVVCGSFSCEAVMGFHHIGPPGYRSSRPATGKLGQPRRFPIGPVAAISGLQAEAGNARCAVSRNVSLAWKHAGPLRLLSPSGLTRMLGQKFHAILLQRVHKKK